MGNKIICIGRAFGSGGHEIAVRLSQRLDIKVYEKQLLYLACQKIDAQRKKYYEHYAKKTWGTRESYDLLIDCGTVSIEQAVELIAERYQALGTDR